MDNLSIDTSAGTFSEIRTKHSYYVDKTDFLVWLLRDGLKGKQLVTRPRRFGKSVMLSTVKEFLDITKDSQSLFEGLKILQEKKLVGDYMNKYPVVFLSLKDVYGQDYEEVLGQMRTQLSLAAHPYYKAIRDSSNVDDDSKMKFQLIHAEKTEDKNVASSLLTITLCLHDHYQKPVVVLIDEYDVPMANAYNKEHYNQVKNLVEAMLSGVCKENDMIQAVFLTGCLYSIKGSTYTGLNNVQPYTVLSSEFSSAIGFTEREVGTILADFGMTEYLDLVRAWYDGYLFSNTHMYCPYDVLRFVRDVQKGNYRRGTNPDNYWLNVSENQIHFIQDFLTKDRRPVQKWDALLKGRPIRVRVDENLPYHRLHDSADNLWTSLLETGYLTLSDTEDRQLLRIPNEEIRGIFKKEIIDYCVEHVDKRGFERFANALWNGDTEEAQKNLRDILDQSFTVFADQYEYGYQYFLAGGFSALDYEVVTEWDAGFGRLDIQVWDWLNNWGLVIETKHSTSKSRLQHDMEEAVKQIGEKRYYRRLQVDKKCQTIHCYGAAFYKKECLMGEYIIPQ